jgi:hypothetical protein
MNFHLWWVHAPCSPQLVERWTCVSSPLLSHTPPQEKSRWSKRSRLTLRLSTWSRWRLLVSFVATGNNIVRFILSFIFVRIPLCNKYLYDIYDIYLYALCYYMCCLLWRIYEMHPALFLKARVWQMARVVLQVEAISYPAEQRAILRKCPSCCILHGCFSSIPLSNKIVLWDGLCTPEIIVRTAHQASSLPLVRV